MAANPAATLTDQLFKEGRVEFPATGGGYQQAVELRGVGNTQASSPQTAQQLYYLYRNPKTMHEFGRTLHTYGASRDKVEALRQRAMSIIGAILAGYELWKLDCGAVVISPREYVRHPHRPVSSTRAAWVYWCGGYYKELKPKGAKR